MNNRSSSRLIRIVNSFAEQKNKVSLHKALNHVAEEFACGTKDVAEAVFPYLSENERSGILALKDALKGAQFIYKCRVRRGMPVSRMRRYGYRTMLVA